MEIKILQYRNSIYQGETKNNKRHGPGILITDDGKIFVGTWKNDLLYGQALIFVNNEEYGFGQINRGELQGYFIFRRFQKTFFAQYNMSKPRNKMLFIDTQKETYQIVVQENLIYKVIHEQSLSDDGEEQLIKKTLNIKFECPSIFEYLENNFCQKQIGFTIKVLQNGNNLFTYDHQSNPHSLGFSLNKNGQLISYGLYVADKLSGLGCKYENAAKYEGMFENGFINGLGLRYSQGKYSFGEFNKGDLVDAHLIDDRSNISEEKLKEFKTAEHLRSLWYYNAYVRKDILKFAGIRELVFEINQQQEYMYPQNMYSSGKKEKNKNLALKMIKRDEFETKSSKSFLVKPKQNKNPQIEEDNLSQGNLSVSGLSALRKFKF